MKSANSIISKTSFFCSILLLSCQSPVNQKKLLTKDNLPNIVIIYMDDLGYGDTSCYGATAFETPNIDKLADGGVRFTNGYSTSATCTPSRYALLTGEYPWRNQNAKILPGTAPLLINAQQNTIPKMLKDKGYHTGIVGKWHLGLGTGEVNWNQKVSPGPNETGFDYSFIMAATQDRVPTVYLENGVVTGLNPDDPLIVNYEKNYDGKPTGRENPELCKMLWHHGHNNSIHNGIPRIGFQKGGKSALWIDENMADTFLEKAKHYIKANKDSAFFLLYTLNQPHVPRIPHPRFVGSTTLGPRGDVIKEADWCIGELINTLEEEGIINNTLIIFSSDNGPVLNDGYYDDAVEKSGNHFPGGILRGGKYSLFEAGTRVPFITFWKGTIKPSVSDALISQIDLFSSLAKLVGSELRESDSQELLDVFLGNSRIGREEMVLEATTRTALRKGEWIMIPPYKGPEVNKQVNIELGNYPEYQLYNLENDIGQQINLAKSEPQKLKDMIQTFIKIRGDDFKLIEQLELH